MSPKPVPVWRFLRDFRHQNGPALAWPSSLAASLCSPRCPDRMRVRRHPEAHLVFIADTIHRSLLSPALNQSREFASRPGICPEEGQEASTSPCTLDADCPGLQKCCSFSWGHRCAPPAPQGRTETCSKAGASEAAAPGLGPGPDLVKAGGDFQEPQPRSRYHGESTAVCGHIPLSLSATSLQMSLITDISGGGGGECS